jgi:hypothetical protein
MRSIGDFVALLARCCLTPFSRRFPCSGHLRALHPKLPLLSHPQLKGAKMYAICLFQ